ncbi:MAG: aconitate hydratase AcnA [Phycisphaerales bacterium]|nr:aconitate hydratase AcnA [Phycisphaerales bacterium]
MSANPFNAERTLNAAGGEYVYHSLGALIDQGVGHVETLPYCLRVLLEAMLRNVDGFTITADDVSRLANWNAKSPGQTELPFMPGRVILQDFTGVPAVVDLAALRSAMQAMGGDPGLVNPQVRCDLIVDHSVQIDAFASATALTINGEKEFQRNRERYEFLKWGQQAFRNFSVVPPSMGIIHQVNLEYLADVVLTKQIDGTTVAYPDSVVGTDSHTTMINGLGVVGWGVGGIEAEAVMLGQPIYMLTPEVVGFQLTGELREGVTATDLVLTVTQMLRRKGVVGKFVEFFGDGLASMSLPDRAVVANMAPEYGATMGFFPIDDITIQYLRFTGRSEDQVALVEAYCKANHLFRSPDALQAEYTDTLELDLSAVEPSLSGPKRPQDRISLADMKQAWRDQRVRVFEEDAAQPRHTTVTMAGETFDLTSGAVAIASITSCTNTSNPDLLITAGLLAKRAAEKGLTPRPWVKTSLAPGSRVVTSYLDQAGLTQHLESLGFHTVAYGCATCIGNSGPLPPEIDQAVKDGQLTVAAVLSGNRNFEGRVHPDVKANYLASPPLVVAYAIAGTVDIDLLTEPIGTTPDGEDVYLKDLWPSAREIRETVARTVTPEQFREQYAHITEGSDDWKAIHAPTGDIYSWPADSTYIQHPPFFQNMPAEAPGVRQISGARCLVKVGDSVTTDHISPAGRIEPDSPAGMFLTEHDVPISLYNSFGSRRGNDRIMTRGTFGNIRVRNHLAPGTEGGWTTDLLDGQVKPIYDAAMHYKEHGTPLVVLAGKDYGMGSSRDWAAKGTYLLGIRAVIAESYERIHRSNLVFMGVLPLQFADDETAESLSLDGSEVYDIALPDQLEPRCEIQVTAHRQDGGDVTFTTRCRIDTPVEVEYYRNEGILHTVLRKMLRNG